MSAFITIDGLNFTIFIRGLLVVGVGITVLMGSIFLLLATNSGFRTGLFLALTAIFGWMFIMGAVWWIYGIGYKGREASWKVVEMNRGDLTAAQFDKAADLGKGLTTLEGGGATPTDGLVQAFAEAEKEAKPPEVAGWTGLLASNRSRGEAQATVDAFLIAAKELPSGSYVPVAAFETGGKEKRGEAVCHPRLINADWSGCPDRVWHRIKIALQPTHPPHYAAIMVQSATPQSLNVRPGEAPPLKVIDESQPLYTVIMERDLGSKRVPPANITIGSGIIFFALAWRLHKRDRQEMAVRAAYAGGQVTEMGQYLPILCLAVLAILFAVLSFAASALLAPRLATKQKQQPYESGIVPGKEPPRRFPVRFYLIAMIFIVFDIEIVFLYPYAIVHREVGLFGLLAVVVFSASVFESFLYLLSKGALDWGPLKKVQRPAHMISGERTSASTVRRVGLEGDDTPEETQIMVEEGLFDPADEPATSGAH